MNTNRCIRYYGRPVVLGVLCNNLYFVFCVSNIWGPQYLILSLYFNEKQIMMCVQYLGGPVLAGRAGGQRTSPTRQRSAVDCYRVSEHPTKNQKVIIQISNRHSWFCFIPIHRSQCNCVVPVLKFEMLFVRIPVQQDTSVLEGIVVRNKVGGAQLADRWCARAV